MGLTQQTRPNGLRRRRLLSAQPCNLGTSLQYLGELLDIQTMNKQSIRTGLLGELSWHLPQIAPACPRPP